MKHCLRKMAGVLMLWICLQPNLPCNDARERIKYSKEGLEIDGKPILPMCAEFHYWRSDPKAWDDILGRMIKGAGFTMVASYIPWSVHEPYKGVFDFTGWTNPRANLEGFLKLLKKHNLYFFARSGPYCYGEIHGGGPPEYANIVGGRTREFLKLSEEWVKNICQIWKEYSIYNGGPLIAIQLDNEILPNSVYFPDFLKEKYGSIKSLNKYWGTNFSDFDSILKDNKAYDGKLSWRNCLDAMEYQTRYFPSWYLSTLREMFKKYGADVPLVSNNTFFACQDWYTLQEESDFIGIDYYAYYLMPGDSYYWDYLYLSLNNNINKFPWSPEFQCGSSMMHFGPTTSQHQKLITFFALASGMRGLNYFMFVERERWEGYCPVKNNGMMGDTWFAHRHFCKVLNDIEWVKLKRHCSIGVIWSMEHFWRFLYEGGRKYNIQPDDYTEVASRTYECAQQPLWDYVKALIDTDTNFDMVDIRTDFSGYPVLLYAGPPLLDKVFQEKLVNYVKGGGRLVFLSSPPCREYDENPSSVLIEELGLQSQENTQKNVSVVIGNKQINTHLFATFKNVSKDEILVRTKDGEVCGVRKRVGKGEVIQIGFAALNPELLKETVNLLNLPLSVQSDNSWIHTSLHLNKEKDITVVIAINRNTKEETARIKIFPDLGLKEDVWIQEEFNHCRLEMKPNQTFKIAIPAKDVAVVHIRKHKVTKEEPQAEEKMRRLFKSVGAPAPIKEKEKSKFEKGGDAL